MSPARKLTGTKTTMSETLKRTLTNHPKLIGALFMIVLLTAQAGSVMARQCHAYHGP